MRTLIRSAAIVCGLLGLSGLWSSAARTISFEERVEAQRAIEKVYFSHLEGPRRTFEQAVTPELLERKVRTYLDQSVALDALWHTPITAEALRREAERIARDTKFPDRLREIQAALNDDAVLYQETFVRASLAGRLSRGFFGFDQQIHAAARDEAERLRERLLDGSLDPGADHPRRILMPAEDPSSAPEYAAASSPFSSWRHESLPIQGIEGLRETPEQVVRPSSTPAAGIGPIEESAAHFSIEVAAPETAAPGVSYRVPKVSWDDWWAGQSEALDETDVTLVAEAASMDEFAAGALDDSCPPDDTWDNGALDDRPDGRYGHAAVWTGTEMIVWAGASIRSPSYTGNAGRYDPLTDTWRGVSPAGAPFPFQESTAVWTGTEMIVWGYRGIGPGEPGGRYDPISDEWRPITTAGEPESRLGHTAVWTGTEMIIWGGGFGISTGARYNSETDSWQPTSLIGAPAPRQQHTAVWTGTEMIVWGGDENPESRSTTRTGARYNPATDSWTPISLANAPTGRKEHTALWTGTEMLVWGGLVGEPFAAVTATGGRYNPSSDSWNPITTVAAPVGRRGHTAVWTGSRMIVWGGSRHSSPSMINETVGPASGGASYDPAMDRWQALSSTNAPLSMAYNSAVWTGSLMVVWGGTRGGASITGFALGGRYDPSTDSWTPTSTALHGVGLSGGGRIVWTGTEMLVWGFGGGRYDPLVDSWERISTTNAPNDQRSNHSVVWTGDEMMIFGGIRFSGPALTGGRFDPVTDSWRSVSTVNAPDVRETTRGVWTGQEVIVWGGIVQSFPSNPLSTGTGGRYDPLTDTWRPLPDRDGPKYDNNAPTAVTGHTAVWTGTEMIVFGGVTNGEIRTDYGARYSPEYDQWTPIPALPNELYVGHTAVWTGTRMLVHSDYGSRAYDLATNSWASIGAPYGSLFHSAVWTGSHMLIWGGIGLAYDAESGAWRGLSAVGAPLPRHSPDAIWTGKFMIVWGGGPNGAALTSGGRYRFGQHSDDDGDLFSECQGDCDDTDAGAWPGAPERCNGRDDSCDVVVDEDANGRDSDGDGTPNACDVCPGFSNPGQTDPLACLAVGEGGGECLETGVVLAAPLDGGVVSVVRTVPSTPEMITFDFLSVTCGTATPVEVFLNEQPLTVFQFETNCEEGSALFHRLTVSDADRIREIWNIDGENVLRLRKAAFDLGTFSGTVFGWARATIGSGFLQRPETICIFDVSGRGCSRGVSEPGWFTFDAVDASQTLSAQYAAEETLSSGLFEDALPAALDISQAPDGTLQLCVGSSDPPLLLAAVEDGTLHAIDQASGATTFYGELESVTMELAHDDHSRFTISQTASSEPLSLQRIRLADFRTVGTLPYIGPHLSGLEVVGGKLYGVEPTGRGARMLEIAIESGSARTVTTLDRDGSWEGLAYDENTGLSYTILDREDSQTLWSIEPGSGLMTGPLYLDLMPTALEFGPDGSLYATQATGDDTELYRLDPATGTATLVGPMGLRDVVSLVTIRNHPRSCIDFVKQGEQTLAINGGCNAPPSAVAGADLAAECASHAGALVVLDGSASSDPDSTAGTNDDIVSFEWYDDGGASGGTLLGVGPELEVQLPVGVHQLRLVVTDAGGESGADDVTVEVKDTTPPVVTASIVRYVPGHGGGDLVGIGASQGWGNGDDDDDGGGHDDDDDGGGHDDDDGGHGDDDDDGGKRYVIRFGATDLCDPSASASARLHAEGCSMAPGVTDGQVIVFTDTGGRCDIETRRGVLDFEASAITLRVTGVDESGNQALSEATVGRKHDHPKPNLLDGSRGTAQSVKTGRGPARSR